MRKEDVVGIIEHVSNRSLCSSVSRFCFSKPFPLYSELVLWNVLHRPSGTVPFSSVKSIEFYFTPNSNKANVTPESEFPLSCARQEAQLEGSIGGSQLFPSYLSEVIVVRAMEIKKCWAIWNEENYRNALCANNRRAGGRSCWLEQGVLKISSPRVWPSHTHPRKDGVGWALQTCSLVKQL